MLTIKNGFERLINSVTSSETEIAKAAADPIYKEIQSSIPVGTGKLKRSYRLEVTSPGNVRVFSDLAYAMVVEFGYQGPPFMIFPVRGSGLLAFNTWKNAPFPPASASGFYFFPFVKWNGGRPRAGQGTVRAAFDKAYGTGINEAAEFLAKLIGGAL